MESSQPVREDYLPRSGFIETREGFGERLRGLVRESGKSQTELAEAAGIGQNTLSNYVQGKRVPDALALGRLAGALDVGLDAILRTGTGGRHVREPEAPYRDGLDPVVRVPIYSAHLGASELGAGGEPSDEIVSYGNVWIRWLRDQARVNPARAFIAPIYGSSMLKLFGNGDLVIGETVDEFGPDDTYALWHDDQLLVKHVRRHRDGIDLVSENTSFPPVQLRGDALDHDRLRIIGRVAGKVTGIIR